MGYRGKVKEREQARRLRARGLTMKAIAEQLGVSKSSVSLWTRDLLEYVPHRRGARKTPHPHQLRRLREIDSLRHEGYARVGLLTNHAFLVAGTALYAAEGSKTDGAVVLPNTDPRMIVFFLRWLRHFFDIDEARLRVRLYLHEGLDLAAAVAFWSDLTSIPPCQFGKPYRAAADPTVRNTKHLMGCPAITYSCSTTHRRIMGLVEALLSSGAIPG